MDHSLTPHEALLKAIAILGGQSALARLCGRKQPTVWNWIKSNQLIPAEHVLAVEAATGISRHLLRPDIYPADLGPSPAWRGVDNGAGRVSFNHRNTLQGRAA